MTRAALWVLALLAASAPAWDATAKAEDGWEYVTTDQGVVVYRKHIEGSEVVAFKGVAYANLSIGKLLAVFQDSSQRQHWVDRYSEHKTLETGPETETYWIHFGLPWPVSDRDYVLRADGKADPQKHVYTAKIKSVTHAKKGDDDCCVRAEVYGTFYEFTALPGEQKTKIVVEVHTDPKGSLPTWLVNLIQKSWPSKTLGGLIRHSTAVQIAPLPEYQDWHAKTAAVVSATKTATTAAK